MNLSRNQQLFASELARSTGLDPRLIAAWIVAEEPAGANAPVGHPDDQNWLNVGNTDGRWFAGARAWKDPITAARRTAAWLRGDDSVPGFGKAAPGIIAFSRTAGQSLATQITALQRSGWASSGYPNLPALVKQVSGQMPAAPASATGASTSSSTGSGLGGWLANAGLTAGLLISGAALAALGVSLLFKPLPSPNVRTAAPVAVLAA